MGYPRRFTESKYDEIVDFSELQDFINVPVKNYSRACARAWVSPSPRPSSPIFSFLDEVLSVGDAKFRIKSEAKIKSMFEKGVTVLFVSHNTDQVRRLCNKAILLDKGTIIALGTADEVCDIYDEKVKKKKLPLE